MSAQIGDSLSQQLTIQPQDISRGLISFMMSSLYDLVASNDFLVVTCYFGKTTN